MALVVFFRQYTNWHCFLDCSIEDWSNLEARQSFWGCYVLLTSILLVNKQAGINIEWTNSAICDRVSYKTTEFQCTILVGTWKIQTLPELVKQILLCYLGKLYNVFNNVSHFACLLACLQLKSGGETKKLGLSTWHSWDSFLPHTKSRRSKSLEASVRQQHQTRNSLFSCCSSKS